MKPIIKIDNISKQYRLGLVGTGTFSHDLNRWWHSIRGKEDPYLKVGEANDRASKGNSDYVWALKDINLEVMPGEVLGIIGKNGAGKSTLLKLLSRVTAPTTGSIKTRGRLASLLEVGTGFHPELTGRENIYLNGAILGMTKREIKSKFDEIVDFAGCERYIETPVKRYSSGMYVRLAFAVAAHLEPEILVVDEVLAVGDAEFQKKAIGKMKDVSKNDGRTVLFVSHSMGAVRNLCTRGLVLDKGKQIFQGTTEESVDFYLSSNIALDGLVTINDNSKPISITKIGLADSLNNYKSNFNITEDIYVKIFFDVNQENAHEVNFYFALKNNNSNIIFRSSDLDEDKSTLKARDVGSYETSFKIPSHFLNKGTYSIYIDIANTNKNTIKAFDDVIAFEVNYGEYDTSLKSYKWGGDIIYPIRWETTKINSKNA